MPDIILGRFPSPTAGSPWWTREIVDQRGDFPLHPARESGAGPLIGLIRVAQAGLVQAKWTDQILDEVFGNLATNRPDLDPPLAWTGGLASALTIGAIAGVLPAIRAARMSPTKALWGM